MWNPFSDSFSSGYSYGGAYPSDDANAPSWAEYYYQRDGGDGSAGSGSPRRYFRTAAELEAYLKTDQASYRRKWQLITIAVVLAAGAAWWHFKRK